MDQLGARGSPGGRPAAEVASRRRAAVCTAPRARAVFTTVKDRTHFGFGAAVSLVLAATCSPSGDQPPPQPPPPPPPRDAAVTSFRRDIAPVLDKHCTAKECHGAVPADDVKLDLRIASSYHQLVNVPGEMGE